MQDAWLKVNDNIELRLLKIDDAEVVFAAIDANRDYLREWLPWVDANQTIKDLEAFICTTHQQFEDQLGLDSAVFYKNTFVGMCGYHPIRTVDHSVTIGYWLHPDYQGLGIISASVRCLIDYAFENMQVNSVRCAHAIGNDKSKAVIERCGFVYDGIQRQAEFLYDHYVDIAHYSILRSEWKPHASSSG